MKSNKKSLGMVLTLAISHTLSLLRRAREHGEMRETGHSSIIILSGRVVLVDAGDPWNGEQLRGRLREEGFETDEVRAYLC